MKKDAYYFSHDSNARHDPNICEMRLNYGMEGYGLYWVMIEMMREQENYKLPLKRIGAIAMQTDCDKTLIKEFINRCINEFELFESDDKFFWSKSLLRRMESKEEKSEKARKAAEKRWEKPIGKNANAMRTQCERNAIKEKKRKRKRKKESKKKKSTHSQVRKKFGEYKHVLLTPDQYRKLLKKWGKMKLQHMIKVMDESIQEKGNIYHIKDFNLALQKWAKKEKNIPNITHKKKNDGDEYEIAYQ